MARVSLGSMVAGLLQYIVLMAFIMPAATGCANNGIGNVVCGIPGSASANIISLTSSTNSILSSSVLHNTTTGAQSNTTGVQAAINNPQYTIGGFLYAGLGSLLTNMLNIPIMELKIFSTTISGISLINQLAIAGIATLSTVIFLYFGWLIVMKIISAIQKIIMEDV